MFEHKFIGKPINNCGLNYIDWTHINYREITASESIIYTKFEVQYMKTPWPITYRLLLNLYVATGKIYSFYYRLRFKTKEQALSYFI